MSEFDAGMLFFCGIVLGVLLGYPLGCYVMARAIKC